MEKLKDAVNCFKDASFKTSDSKGRKNEKESEMNIFSLIKDPFWIDEQKILNSKSFKRLSGKTQVFPLSSNASSKNRLIHSLEVRSIAEIIAKILGLNISLIRAIAISHDIGHTPFGHLGEKFLSSLAKKGFQHEVFGPILLEEIEKRGKGLNLCFETLEGIKHHSKGEKRITINNSIPLEYTVVMLADKIAYTFSDINDCIRLGRLKKHDFPKKLYSLGENQKEQVNSCIRDLCLESKNEKKISFSQSKTAKTFRILRKWMLDNVYLVMDQEKERVNNLIHLKKAYYFIKNNIIDPSVDPSKVLAIMTNEEVLTISAIVEKASIADIKKIKKYDFWESIPYCQAD